MIHCGLSFCSVEVQQVIQLDESDQIYVVGYAGSSQFHAYQINAMNGELLNHETAAFSGGFVGDVALVSSDTLVTLDTTRSILVTVSFKNRKITFQETHLSNLGEDSSGMVEILPSSLTGMFTVKINNYKLFIRLTSEDKLEVVHKVDHETVVSDALVFSEGKEAFAVVEHGGSKVDITVKLGQDWNNNLVQESIEMDHQRGLVHKVFINNYLRTDRSHGFRALIVMEDHSLLLVQQGKIVWNREDALASIIDVTTSELPVEKEGVSVAKVEHSLFEWLKV